MPRVAAQRTASAPVANAPLVKSVSKTPVSLERICMSSRISLQLPDFSLKRGGKVTRFCCFLAHFIFEYLIRKTSKLNV